MIILSGLPGTGKSMLAERVARTLRAPAFAGDWLGLLRREFTRYPHLIHMVS